MRKVSSTRAAPKEWTRSRRASAADSRAHPGGHHGGADVLGLSAGGVLKPDMVKRMAKDPLILALANPTPEILPEEAKAVRADAITRDGPLRLSKPGQQRPVLSLLFRGAVDEVKQPSTRR